MTDVTMTFRIDPALKAAFAAMAGEQDLSAAQVLRQMMRDALEKHDESTAHERWQRREIDDAMHEADAAHGLDLSSAMIEEDWRLRKNDTSHDDS
ncbi:hypothetical protein [Sphingomonas oryzagri]